SARPRERATSGCVTIRRRYRPLCAASSRIPLDRRRQPLDVVAGDADGSIGDEPCELAARAKVELSVDARQVRLDGRDAHEQCLRDLAILPPLGDKGGDAALGGGQLAPGPARSCALELLRRACLPWGGVHLRKSLAR